MGAALRHGKAKVLCLQGAFGFVGDGRTDIVGGQCAGDI